MEYPPDAIFYVRISFMTPKDAFAQRVIEINEDLLAFFTGQPGFVRGYWLASHEPKGEIGRVTVWRSEADADRAATTQHVLAVRSELLRLIEEDSHVERSFTAYDPQLAKASP